MRTVARAAWLPGGRERAAGVVVLVVALLSFAQLAAAADHRLVGRFAVQAPDGAPSHLKRLAVERSTGNLLVANTAADTVDVYAPTASGADLLTSLGSGELNDPYGVAVSQSDGSVYVSDAGNGRIAKYLSDGAPTPTYTQDPTFRSPVLGTAAGELSSFAAGLAVDPTSHDLLVADPGDGTAGSSAVERYDADGRPIGSFDGSSSSDGAFAGLLDVAADSSGDVIVVDATSVRRYSGDGSVHQATLGPVTAAATVAVGSDDDVYVSGDQDSIFSGQPLTVHRFGAGNAETEVIRLPASTTQGIVAGVAVDDGPAVRLYAATDVDTLINALGEASIQAYEVPQPAAPAVTTGVPSYISADTARVTGVVDPNLRATTYWFEYGTTTAYGQRFPLSAGSDAGSGDEPVEVRLQLPGLQPSTTYHYRLVASNSLGDTAGADRSFSTGPSAVEKPARAYEMVSPVSKSGVPVGQDNDANTIVARALHGGDQIFYSARGAFSAADPGSYLRTIYIGARGRSGWSSRSAEAPMLANRELQPSSVLQISDDGSRSLVRSTAVLAPGATEDATNLYIRSNDSGSYEFVASVPFSATSPFVGATSDFSHLVIALASALTPDAAPGVFNVYEWTDGHLRLVSHLPDGTVDPGGSSDYLTLFKELQLMHSPRIISADGSRILFDTADSSGEPSGLFVRVDGTETTAISASQRSGDPDGARPAKLGGASADGRFVYFMSAENLTDGSDTRGRNSLYRYDGTTRALTDLTVATDPADVNGANVLRVLGVSDDGAYIYFAAGGNLARGGVTDGVNVYVWHDGATTHIATLDSASSTEARGPATWSLSPNGQHFAFSSFSNAVGLTGEETSGPNCPRGQPACREVFAFDANTSELDCVSCPPNGQTPVGSARMGSDKDGRNQYWRRFVLDDGTVFFDTPEQLSAGDANGRFDVYEWSAGSRRIISPGVADAEARFSDASPDGSSVFFTTSEPLVGQDVDSIVDLYVARLRGGFSEQSPPPSPPPCDADECQGAATPRPPLSSFGTGGDAAAPESRPAPAGRAVVQRLSERARRAFARRGTTTIAVKLNRAGRVTLIARARIGKQNAVVARAAKIATRAGSVRLTLTLSHAARRELAQRRVLRVRLGVAFAGRSQSTTIVLRKGR